MKRIIHVIVGLGKGGAETMLYQLVKYRSTCEVDYQVFSLGQGDYYRQLIEAEGVSVACYDIKIHPLKTLCALTKAVKHVDGVCCWMYHANLIGFVAARLAGVKNITWFIRHSNLDPGLTSRSTIIISKICAKLSKHVSSVVYNGEASKQIHEKSGYDKQKSVVLGNGCDTNIYKPNPSARVKLCDELGIAEDKRIIASVSRYHPIKDIPTFLKSFSLIHNAAADTVAIMCGRNIDTSNDELVSMCKDNGLEIGKSVFLLGLRNDIQDILAACDLYILHSAGEAFPNTLIQAMACGCLCISTDVGDARKILNNDQFIVPVGDVIGIVQTAYELLNIGMVEKKIITDTQMNRVANMYGINHVSEEYEKLFLGNGG